jgi:hypothetical protein
MSINEDGLRGDGWQEASNQIPCSRECQCPAPSQKSTNRAWQKELRLVEIRESAVSQSSVWLRQLAERLHKIEAVVYHCPDDPVQDSNGYSQICG